MKKLAIECADKGILKLLCMVWSYNFAHNQNTADNFHLWNMHLKYAPTVAVKLITDSLSKLNEYDKLKEFLDLKQLNKTKVAPKELGKAYSLRFFHLLNEKRIDELTTEVEEAFKFIKTEHLNENISKRMTNEV